MGRPVSDARGQRGFTLVELMVATTVTVMVAGSTVGILRSMAAARKRVNRQMTLQAETRSAINTIAAALHNAYRSGGEQAVLEGADDWYGEIPADRITLFTISRRTIRPGEPESDVKECQFVLTPPTDRAPPALIRRTDPTRNDPPDGGGIVELIAENVLGMDIAYHDGEVWLDEWTEEMRGWPVAVRIRLAIVDVDRGETIWTTSRIVNFPRRPAQASGDQGSQTGSGAGDSTQVGER